MEDKLIVQKIISINAGIAKVWEAITNPELTRQYMFNSEVISGWNKGSSVLWRDADNKKVHVKGIITDIKPGEYLETSDLSIDSGLEDKESNYSRVRYELKKDNDKTLLYLTEDKFNSDYKRYIDADNFWTAVIKRMKELLEK